MIVLTVNVSGALHVFDENGARVVEPIHVFSVPLDALSPEQIRDTFLDSLRIALEPLRAEVYQRVNVTFAFEVLPSAGVYVLTFPRKELPNDKPE